MTEEEYIRFLSWVKPIEEIRKNREEQTEPQVQTEPEPSVIKEKYDPKVQYATEDLTKLDKFTNIDVLTKRQIFVEGNTSDDNFIEILLVRARVIYDGVTFWVIYLEECKRNSEFYSSDKTVFKTTRFYRLFTDPVESVIFRDSINKLSDLPIKSICKLCNGTGKYTGFSTIEKCKCVSES